MEGLSAIGESKFEFLQLLVTQLQHQDPIEPVDQENFMQQLASFTTVEEIEKLNLRFDEMLRVQELSQGYDLVGRDVRFLEANQLTTGKVDEVQFEDGQVMALVEGRQVPVSSITSIIA